MLKVTLRHTSKLLFLVPAMGLISIGLQQTAWADGHSSGGDDKGSASGDKQSSNGDDKKEEGGSKGGSTGSKCDVPEPEWFIMMATGGLPMGLKLFRRRWMGSN